LREGVYEARRFLDELREAGVDYDDVTEVLEREGVEKFAASFRELIGEIQSKGRRLARQP
ncbi:MAG: transaldolase, partial [Rubrobacter sp.]|nr:transaldolase [Rubrobacter sp.]